MKTKVFKFGGASIQDVSAIQNVEQIISQYRGEPLVLVVSAMGKTTNALEKVVDAYFSNKEEGQHIAKQIKETHQTVADQLLANAQPTKDKINNYFVEIDWILEDDIESDYSYVYDQIVSMGELCSSTIVADYLIERDFPISWIDARELIHTNDIYQQAEINWKKTQQSILQKGKPCLDQGKIILTQGFIGSTSDNNTTTLGREGSDFTGAILANCLNADSLTIWKDVPGVLNADPRWLDNTVKLSAMNYREAVEQSYYGAKVIHPKTIKPLQNKNIPLHVRSFKDTLDLGTTIGNQKKNDFNHPIYILKDKQVLLHCFTKDLSFFNHSHINHVMQVFDQNHCDIHLLQNGAVQCSFVFDEDEELIQQIQSQLEKSYSLHFDFDLDLLTIRHYNQPTIDKMTQGKDIFLEQRTPMNYQVLYKAE